MGSRKSTAATVSRGAAAQQVAVSNSIGEELMSVPEEDTAFEGTDQLLGSRMDMSGQDMDVSLQLKGQPYNSNSKQSLHRNDRGSQQRSDMRIVEQEESKRMVRDIFQDSVNDNFFTQAPTENTLTKQPKVEFDLDADEAEESQFGADNLKLHSHRQSMGSNVGGGHDRFSTGSNNKRN